MTLDKHQIDGVGGFAEKVLPAAQFEELMTNAGYSKYGSAPAQGGGFKVWWGHEIFSTDQNIVITAYHV